MVNQILVRAPAIPASRVAYGAVGDQGGRNFGTANQLTLIATSSRNKFGEYSLRQGFDQIRVGF